MQGKIIKKANAFNAAKVITRDTGKRLKKVNAITATETTTKKIFPSRPGFMNEGAHSKIGLDCGVMFPENTIHKLPAFIDA